MWKKIDIDKKNFFYENDEYQRIKIDIINALESRSMTEKLTTTQMKEKTKTKTITK